MEKASLLSSICQAVSASCEPVQLYEILYQKFFSHFGKDLLFCAALVDQKHGIVTPVYAAPYGVDTWQTCNHPADNLTSRVLFDLTPILINQISSAELPAGIQCVQTDSQAWFGFPISHGKTALGLIVLQFEPPLPIEEDLDSFCGIGQVIGAFVRARQAEENQNLFASQLAIVTEIARETTGPLEIDHIINHSTALLKERFGFHHVAIYLVDPLGQHAILREPFTSNIPVAPQQKIVIPSPSVIAKAIANAEIILIDESTHHPPESVEHLLPSSRSALVIPLKSSNWVLGAMDIQSTLPSIFSPQYILILQVLCDQIALALEKARLFEQTIHRVEREQKVIEITGKLRSANDISKVLEIAVRELKEALGVKQVQIILQRSEENKKLEEFI
ncbi:MAG: GAF domain-containing protein [Anaerolineae bacterium]|nr:GAF domain-containing protein [Anaerolineae bacterium]